METGSRISLEVDFLHIHAGAFRRKLLPPVIDRNLNIKLLIRSRGTGLKLIEGIAPVLISRNKQDFENVSSFEHWTTFLSRRNFEFYLSSSDCGFQYN